MSDAELLDWFDDECVEILFEDSFGAFGPWHVFVKGREVSTGITARAALIRGHHTSHALARGTGTVPQAQNDTGPGRDE